MEESKLVAVEDSTIIQAYTSGDGLESVVQEVKDIVDRFEYNLETSKGRKAIASLSAKISSIKVRFDDLGKDLTVDWKAKSKAVDASRKQMRDELDTLRVEARKPLTDWENAEKDRVDKLQEQVQYFTDLGTNALENWEEMYTDTLKTDLEICENTVIDDTWQEWANRGAIEKDDAIRKLTKAVRFAEARDELEAATKKKAEEDAARARLEREERIAQEAREQAVNEASIQRALLEERAATAEFEARREKELAEAKIKTAQEDKMRAEAEAKVSAERAVEDEKRRVADAEANKKAEQLARERNKANIGKVRKAAKLDLMALGIDEATAKKVVMAIHHGKVANVNITY